MLFSLQNKKLRSLAGASIVIALLLFAGKVSAQTSVLWSNSSASTWATTTNWTGGVVPTATVIATFSVNPTSASSPVTFGTGTTTVGAISVLAARTNGLTFENVAAQTANLALNGVTVNSVSNTVISNLTAYNSTPKICSLSSNTTGSLGITLGTAAGAWIVGGGAGSNSKVGNTTYISSVISGTSSQPITFLGGGTYDPNLNPTLGFNGATLELAGANTFTGGIIVGDNTGSPTYGNSGSLMLDALNAISNTAGNNITVNNNSQLYLLNVATGTFNTSNITLTLNGIGNNANSGALRAKGTAIAWPGPIVLGSDAEITTQSATTVFSLTGTVTGGAHLLQFQGSGNVVLTNPGNSWGSSQIGNGTCTVAPGGSFSTGALNMAQSSTNSPTMVFNNAAQTLNGLFASITSQTVVCTNTLTLNGTRLTINQSTDGTFGTGANSLLTSIITGTGSIVKTGSAKFIIISAGTNFSGGLKVSQGEFRFNPLASTTISISSADTLDGGTIGTNGINASASVALNTLTLTNNSTIDLDPTNIHRIIFANSSSSVWTSGKMITITNWTGSYSGGTSGTIGQLFFGSDATGLTMAQLAQIQFFDGTTNHPAILLSTGELVPAPSITATAAAFGPFCNAASNPVSIVYTTAGTFASTTFSVQLSNASGIFPADATSNIIGTGTSSPISASIASATIAGTGYRIRVVNAGQTILGTNNGSDITVNASPTAYSVSGSGSICAGATGIDIQLSNSQTGVNYQLYNGTSAIGSTQPGTTGSAVDFGHQSVAGTYTVLATASGCTTAMSGSGSVTVNPLPAPTISGSTLVDPGGSAVLTFTGTTGDVIAYTDGVTSYSITLTSSTGTATVTPSSTTTYSVTSASSALGCSQPVVTGQSATVTVSSAPTAIVVGATTICPAGNANLVFSGTASGVVHYTPDGGTTDLTVALSSGSGGVGTATVNVTPATTTTYALTSIVSAGTFTLSGSVTVTVSALPTQYAVTGTGSYCAGSAGVAVGLSNSQSGINYQLYTGATLIGSPVAGIGGSISFGVFTTAATYTVLATNSFSCTSVMTGSAVVSINPLPIAYSVTGTGSYCAGGSGIALGLSNSQTGVNYTLYNGSTSVSGSMSGTTGSPVSFGSYTAAGTYTVAATNGTTTCSNNMTGNAVITINPQPVPGAISGPSVISVGGSMTLSDDGGSGIWSSTSPSVGSIGSASGTVSGLTAGVTTISYTVTNGCGTLAATQTVTVTAVITSEVVISQVYPGGGKTSAIYNTEYVELYNSSASPITMTNWSIQYVAAVGGTWAANTFSGTIAAHKYFLIAMASGPTGTVTPTADASPVSPSSLNTSNGMIALVANSTVISSIPTGALSGSTLTGQDIVDFVGYGTAVSYLTAAAPAPSPTLAIFRGNNGCLNAGNNSTDFATPATPAPRNSASSANVCTVPGAYYSAASGNLDATTTWGTNTDGSGTHPADFVSGLQTFHVANANPGNFSGSTWTVSGSGSVVNLDAATNLTIPATTTVNATINVGPNRTLTIANHTLPTFGGVDAASTIVYSNLLSFTLPSSFAYGNLTLANTPITNTTGSTLSFNGNFTLTGSSTFNAPGTSISTTGTANQTISGNGTTLVMNGFTDSKTAGTVTLATGTNLYLSAGSLLMVLNGGVTNQFSDGGNSITVFNNLDLSGNAASYNLTGTMTLIGSGSGSQNIRGGSGLACIAQLNNLELAGALQVKLNPTGSGSLTVKGNLIFSSVATGVLNFEGDTLKLGGNFYDSTTTDLLTMTTAGSTLNFNGSSAQTYYSAVSGGNTVNGLAMNNGAGLTLNAPLSVSGTLKLNTGNISTGGNALTLLATGNVNGASASSYINGNFVKNMPAAGVTFMAFEVGDVTYAPIKLTFGASVNSGGIEVSATHGSHPQIAASYINTANFVNRYWTITDLGASPSTVNVALSYNNGDMTGGSNTGYSMRQYAGSWSTSPSVANSTSSSAPLLNDATTATGVSGAAYSADYVVGLPDCTGATGGTSTASVTAICGTGTSVISLGGASSGAAITYQWQSSADGSSYTTIDGATTTSYTTSVLSATTYYHCIVGCGFTGTTSTSVPVTVTVNALPSVPAITGSSFNVCTGSVIALSDATTGGVWSATSANASVDGSGNVSGSAAGTATISYTVTGAGGCTTQVTTIVTVNALPTVPAITGSTFNVCTGSVIALSDATIGGTWNAASANASVDGSGNVFGSTAGTATISYSFTNGAGCANTVTTIVTVNALPTVAAITGSTLSVCAGSSISFTDVTTGGSWFSGSDNASVNGTGGVIGTSAGTATISYSVFGACTNTVTVIVTVNATPSAGTISGPSTICSGVATTFTDGISGGVWSASDGSVTVVGTSGLVTGVTGGSPTISYVVTASGCSGIATKSIAVNLTPTVSAITSSTLSVCAGSSISLTDITTGGSWFSGSDNASVNGTGGVSGTSAGTATISYSVFGSCTNTVTVIVTVNATPSAGTISGPSTICTGVATAFTDGISGGVWSASDGSVTVVGTSGLVTGVTGGSPTISYVVTASGCSGMATKSIAVNLTPTVSAITGSTLSVCAGSSISLTDVTAGGSWTSGSANASVNGTGGVTGASAGTATISYSVFGACTSTATTVVTVNATNAGTISGPATVSITGSILLTDIVAGGTWGASNGNATVTGGTVTGVAAGSVIIAYSVTGTCGVGVASKTITVNSSSISGINGNPIVCMGVPNTLTDVATGGVWSSGNILVAGVGSASGIVSGVNAGTANITYALGGDITILMVSVNPAPTGIAGSQSQCVGTTITLSDATPGGSWSNGGSVNTSVSGSAILGVSAGSSTITYTLPSGCFATYPNMVNPNPTPIMGTFAVCVGSVTSLTDATTGSISFTSSNTLQATASNSGAITGVSAGSPTITYKLTLTGCIATQVITVSNSPAAITGTTSVCAGGTTDLNDPAGPGTWSSNNTTVATIGSGTGIVTGMAGGVATITYVASPGCKTTTIVTVNTILPINGTMGACLGTSTTLTDGTAGGTWLSGTTGIATIGSTTGIVTGAGIGSVPITYTLSSGCSRTTTVSIGAMTPIQGVASACKGAKTTLSDLTSGGTWSSSNSLVATVGTSGIVTASATNVGTVTISYTVGTCPATQVVTVNATPAGISGLQAECQGVTIALTDATIGGSWSNNGSANTSIDVTGHLLGITAGSSTVTYTLSTGCFSTYPNLVNPNPTLIQGAFAVCVGAVTSLTDATTGSISYTSSNTLQATASNSGAITGVAAGNPVITYKLTLTGCQVTQMITVNPLPVVSAISGVASISHAGGAVTLSDLTVGGFWTSSAPTVISLTGTSSTIVTAAALQTSGESLISYAVTNAFGCKTTMTKIISATARYASTTGSTTTLYTGATATIIDAVNTGAWSSSDNETATVDEGGIVTGIRPGTGTITHLVTGDDGEITTSITPVVVTSLPVDVRIIPNPNKGAFIVKGTLGTSQDQDVTIEITNVLGQVIYKAKTIAYGGNFNEPISLGSSLANGMYMLNVRSGADNKVVHFVIEQ